MSPKTNGLAITSLVLGILSWLFALIMACINWIIIPFFAIATMGAGAMFYVCTCIIGILPPIGWLIGTITGYVSRNHIRQTGEGGLGMANAGFILNLSGLTLTILLFCGVIAYALIFGSTSLLSIFGSIPNY